MSMYETLSEVPGLGHVVLCRNCEDVHVTNGHAAFRLPLKAFRQLNQMIQDAEEHPLLNRGAESPAPVCFEDGFPYSKPMFDK